MISMKVLRSCSPWSLRAEKGPRHPLAPLVPSIPHPLLFHRVWSDLMRPQGCYLKEQEDGHGLGGAGRGDWAPGSPPSINHSVNSSHCYLPPGQIVCPNWEFSLCPACALLNHLKSLFSELLASYFLVYKLLMITPLKNSNSVVWHSRLSYDLIPTKSP